MPTRRRRPSRAAAALTRAGLRDSKSFGATPKGRALRADLAAKVRSRACFVAVRIVDVCEIDRRVTAGELNVLEREIAVSLIRRAPAADRARPRVARANCGAPRVRAVRKLA
ncbi:MAG: hypothetical protein KY464_09735 [Gemmatimonadetes bacterium]|nr:hypothetical protein [Gemmatimonadota bacterium]